MGEFWAFSKKKLVNRKLEIYKISKKLAMQGVDN